VSIGQPITVNVELAGLETGQALDSLAATVVFDGSLLGTPTITAGPIVPNPLDNPLDLLINADTGLADVAFLTFGTDAADHITSNGVFFSLVATAAAPGSASIAFDFSGATLFNAANPDDPTILPIEPGQPISFTVLPEPRTIALAYVLAFALHRSSRKRLEVRSRPFPAPAVLGPPVDGGSINHQDPEDPMLLLRSVHGPSPRQRY
jgi:hypothetical protein